MKSSSVSQYSKSKVRAISLGFIAFGLYLLFGAFVSISGGTWPIYMPPQLDIFGILFGAYFGGIVSFMLGAFFIWLGSASIWRKK